MKMNFRLLLQYNVTLSFHIRMCVQKVEYAY